MRVKAPSKKEVRTSLRQMAAFAPDKDRAQMSLLSMGIAPEAVSKAVLPKPASRARDHLAGNMDREVLSEHDIQSACISYLKKSRNVAWVGRYNSGKFQLEGDKSSGQADRWFSANTVPGQSDIMGGLRGTRASPGCMFALEVKQPRFKTLVARVCREVDAGTFDVLDESKDAVRVSTQYGFLLKVRAMGCIGEFVFDVMDVHRIISGVGVPARATA